MKAKRHRLGELCRMVKGTSPTLKTEPGPYPLVVTAAYRRTADSWQLEGPAVCIPLVSSTGHGDAALHRVHYQEGKFALANLLVALLPNDPSLCNAKYLYHLLMVQKDELLVPLMQGTANVSLKEQDIADVEISLPPLSEQRRIVVRIEELAAQIHEASSLRHQATAEAEALPTAQTSRIFEELLRGELHPIRTLGCDEENPIQIGPFGAQLHKTEFVEDGTPVLNVGNVWPDGLRLDYLDHVTEEKAHQLRRYSIKAGDLLFARSGATLGKVCLVPSECDSWLMTGHLFRVRFDPERIFNRFAFAALRGSLQVQEQIFGQVRGATRPGNNTTF